MSRGRLSLLMALMAVAALMVVTTGSTFAANKTHPPILSLAKSGPSSVAYNALAIPYTVTFMVNKSGAKNVVLEDNFLGGLDLDVTSPVVFSGPNVPVVTQTFAAQGRNTYTIALGDLPPTPNFTTYTVTYTAFVTPGYYTARSSLGKNVKDTVNLYVNGKWTGKAQTIANLTQ